MKYGIFLLICCRLSIYLRKAHEIKKLVDFQRTLTKMIFTQLLCFLFLSYHVKSWFLTSTTNAQWKRLTKAYKLKTNNHNVNTENRAQLHMASTTNDPKLTRTIESKNVDQSNTQKQPFQPYIPPLKNIKNRINEIIPTADIESIRMRYIQVATEEIAQECKSMITKGK